MKTRILYRAFTLIEFLVVIAIIAILAALILPVLSSSKQRASATQCRNNERQIGIAVTMYQGDWNQFPYECIVGVQNAKGGIYWFDALQTYTASSWGRGIMKCPNYQWFCDEGHLDSSSAWYAFGSYSYNGYGAPPPPGKPRGLGGSSGGTFKSPPVTEANVRRPSEMYAMGDARLSNYHFPAGAEYRGTSGYFWWTYTEAHLLDPPRQHPHGLNMLFVDGHAALIRTNILFNIDPEFKRRWNNDYEAD